MSDNKLTDFKHPSAKQRALDDQAKSVESKNFWDFLKKQFKAEIRADGRKNLTNPGYWKEHIKNKLKR